MKQATMIMLTDNIGGYSQTICSREQMITPFVVVVVVVVVIDMVPKTKAVIGF